MVSSSIFTFFIERNGKKALFPQPISEEQFSISWEISQNISFFGYCLELKTRKETVLSTGEIGFAYYSSGKINSQTSSHTLAFPLDLSVWEGIIEIRLRLFNEEGKVIASTHPLTDEIYPFEPLPQGLAWNSEWDGFYFLIDKEVETISNTIYPVFSWRNSEDVDSLQRKTYEIEWSTSPLFNEGVWYSFGEVQVLSGRTAEDLTSRRTTFSPEILVESSLFYRVRAFDGLDYGPWSKINGFFYSPSAVPICYFSFIETNSTEDDSNSLQRPSGEVEIAFRIQDADSKWVSAHLGYRTVDGIEAPLILSSSTVTIPTGREVSITWFSFKQFPDQKITLYFTLYADDGSNRSEVILSSPVLINNTGISFGNGDVGGGDLSFTLSSNYSGKTKNSVVILPDVKSEYKNGAWKPKPIPSPPSGEELLNSFSWKEYWESKNTYETEKFTTCLMHVKLGENGKEKIWRSLGDLVEGTDYSWSNPFSKSFAWASQSQLNQTIPGKIKRGNFIYYDGYDDGNTRNGIEQLLLFYEDELSSENSYNGSSGGAFVDYLLDNRKALEKWCKENGVAFDANAVGLGKTQAGVSFFLPTPLYGKSFTLQRPRIIHEGTLALYADGSILDGNLEKMFKGKTTTSGDTSITSYPDGVKDLMKKDLLQYLYYLDPMYDPKPKQKSKGTVLGPYTSLYWEDSTKKYWSLFEYSLKIFFPLLITPQNSRAAYRYNGELVEIDLLSDGEEEIRLDYSSSLSSVNSVLSKLFPEDIFETITSERVTKFSDKKKWEIHVFSKKNSSNRSFQFVETEFPCYLFFGIDQRKRFSSSSKGFREDKWILKKQKEDISSNIEFELEKDDGDFSDLKNSIPSGEPLFTCEKDFVAENGFHFKYSPERFAESKKIYIRKYRVETVFSEKNVEDGYRSFTLEFSHENGLGEKLYRKVPKKTIGGAPAIRQKIKVLFEEKEIEEFGWWPPYGNSENYPTHFEDPKECLSHTWDEEKEIYIRKDPKSFIEKIGFKPVFVAEYVDIEEAFERPLIDQSQGGDKLHTRQPMLVDSNVMTGYIQYIMGAYRPPTDGSLISLTSEQISQGKTTEDLVQTEIVNYENDFSSVVYPSTDGKNLGRYSDHWAPGKYHMEHLRTVVDPFFIEPEGYEVSIRKFGYQPEVTLETYFKEDTAGTWEGKIIPKSSNVVHEIYRKKDGEAQSANESLTQIYLGRIHKDRLIIPDSNRQEYPKDEATKLPYLDYRLKGSNPYSIKNYFSSLPTEESEEYKKRPVGVYGEDRPTRISGMIDSLLSASIKWKFLYLQTSWNSYNLIHWEGVQSADVYAKLEVTELRNGEPTTWYSVKTQKAIWFENFKAYLIPYEKLKQSAYLDTLNGKMAIILNDGSISERGFEDGKEYQFRISQQNINGGVNDPAYSEKFTYSTSAYSPPIILSTTFNQWTGEFCIEYRLDDVLGRKYDITGVSYATYGEFEDSPADVIFEGNQIPIDSIIGKLEDLESNTKGGLTSNVISHKLYIPNGIVPISGLEGKLIRFRLDAMPSEERDGIIAPVFSFRMWANEELKKIDKTISEYIGSWNNWILKLIPNETTGEEEQVWEYSRTGVFVPGKIDQENQIINSIQEKFEKWYVSSAVKFDLPGFEARYAHLCSLQNGAKEFFLKMAIQFFAFKNLSSEWAEFLSQKEEEEISERALAEKFISEKKLEEDWKIYWNNYGPFSIPVHSGFASYWAIHSASSREDALNEYVQTLHKDYSKWLEDNSKEDSLTSKDEFVKATGKTNSFESFYHSKNLYHNSAFSERKKWIEKNNLQNWENWKSSPVNFYGESIDISSLGEDDQTLLYFSHTKNLLMEMDSLPNSGKEEAYYFFLSTTVNGISYGQQIQTSYSNIASYQKILSEAYRERNILESNHRKKLIMAGFFSNGWKNNEAYNSSGKKNLIFRFRVENLPASGKVNKNPIPGLEYDPDPDYPEESSPSQVPVPGYDTQWDVYYHFQMDLFDSFDSQNGLPFRDYLYMRADLMGYAGSDSETWMRISGAIEADSGNMSVLPSETYNPISTSLTASPSVSDPYSYQLAGRFAIPKSDLPGKGQYNPFTEERSQDILPKYWNSGTSRLEDDWNQLFFWRVAPYNLVERPLLEKEQMEIHSLEKISENNFWKIKFSLQIFGDHTYLELPMSSGYWDDNLYKYFWVAYSKLENPIWKKDSQSSCLNSDYSDNPISNDGAWSSFFHGGNSDFQDTDSSSNTVVSSFSERILSGEIIFLTDRQRELVEETDKETGEITTTLEVIQGKQFESSWLPLSVPHEKFWVLRDTNGNGWFGVSQKLSRSFSDGRKEYVLVLSKGLSPNCMGDVEQILPKVSLDPVSTVLEGAISFESPCLIKQEEWTMYFSAEKDGKNILIEGTGPSWKEIGNYREVKEDKEGIGFKVKNPYFFSSPSIQGFSNVFPLRTYRKEKYFIYFSVLFSDRKEVYRISSADILDWGNLEKISSLPLNLIDFAVYPPTTNSENWKGYGVVGLSIKKFTSLNGVDWVDSGTMYEDQYTVSRPSLVKNRLFFSISTAVEGISGTSDYLSRICSIDESLPSLRERIGSLKSEKGGPVDPDQYTLPLTKDQYAAMGISVEKDDRWYNPMVLMDYDKGTPIQRIVYSSSTFHWAYSSEDRKMIKTEYATTGWFTEYLEEWGDWKKEILSYGDYIQDDSSNINVDGVLMPILTNNGEKVGIGRYNTQIPVGDLEAIFRPERDAEPKAVKFHFRLSPGWKEERSEGNWISAENVGNTEAWLDPEIEDLDRNPDEFTVLKFLEKEELTQSYLSWLGETYPGSSSSNEKIIEWLLLTKNYSLYLKWSKKGPGFYKHLYAVETLKYWGMG